MIRYLGKKGVQVLDAGDGGPPPSSGALRYIVIPFYARFGQYFSSPGYLEWRDPVSSPDRANTSYNSSTIIGADSTEPTKIFAIPPAPSFSKINIYLTISMTTIAHASAGANLALRRNGAEFIYENMTPVSRRPYSASSDVALSENFEIKNLAVSPGDYFGLYVYLQSGANIYFAKADNSTYLSSNMSHCIVEEVT